MAHRITAQNRGRGGPTYRAPSHRYKAGLRHAGTNIAPAFGHVVDIEHDPARHAPIALARLEDGRKVLATEGLGVGDAVSWGPGAEVKNGNTLPLGRSRSGHTSATSKPARTTAASSSAQAASRPSSSVRQRTAESVSGCRAARISVQRCLFGNRRYRCRR